MTDIVERLRMPIDPDDIKVGALILLVAEAADEIERLRAVLKKIAEALDDRHR